MKSYLTYDCILGGFIGVDGSGRKVHELRRKRFWTLKLGGIVIGVSKKIN